MTEFPPTDQQQAARDAAATGQDVVIQAGAGAGKTSTMRFLARDAQQRGQRGIYTAFNKAIVESAKGSFPRNVHAATTFSIAWNAGGDRWRDRINIKGQTLRDVARILSITEPAYLGKDVAPLSVTKLARHAVATVRAFCSTADDELAAAHVPAIPGLDTPDLRRALTDAVLPYALRAWDDMAKPQTGQLKVDHSLYFKRWALKRPQIPADFLLVDEVQDTDPVLAGVLRDQTHLQRILVGDSAQSIYCQPLGTMVEVPVLDAYGTPDPERRRCFFDDCQRARHHRISGLCDQHERHRRAGRPLATIPVKLTARTRQTRQIRIENLRVGDRVISYRDRQVSSVGRPITAITRFHHDGELVRVATASGETSAYTPRHHCIVRLGAELLGKHVVYLMRRGDHFRVGRVPLFYGSQNNGFGPGIRAGQEGADALWILSVHDSAEEVALAEALTQARFGLPGLRFAPTNGQDVLDVVAFWRELGSNQTDAETCLSHFGRLLEFPLWTSGRKVPVGVRRPITTAAANLFDGMRVLPLRNAASRPTSSNTTLWVSPEGWKPITVSREWYSGDVISLEVDDHHTYFADGLLTHNSWRGCVDITGDYPDAAQLQLTKSFRFGPAVAAEANKWLDLLDAKIRLQGHDPVRSVLDRAEMPDAVLTRTNAEAVVEAIEAHEQGVKVHLAGAGDEIRALAAAAADLMARKGTFHRELQAFQSWDQVRQYVDDGMASTELETTVRLLDTHGVDAVVEAISRTVAAPYADRIITTVHKCKGLEWDVVRIANDWQPPKREDEEVRPELAMLAYVAVTRAKKVLDRGGLAWVDRWARIPARPASIPQPRPEPALPTELARHRVGVGPGLARAVEALRAAQQRATEPGYSDTDRADDAAAIVAAYLDQRVPRTA